MNQADLKLASVLHRITLSLLSLVESYSVDPQLISRVAEELETTYRTYLPRHDEAVAAQGKLAMERLLDELEARGAPVKTPRAAGAQ